MGTEAALKFLIKLIDDGKERVRRDGFSHRADLVDTFLRAGLVVFQQVLHGAVALDVAEMCIRDRIYTIQAPIVIMDDSSFATYCEQIGVSSAENGSVVLNRIWDNINSNFRYKEYVPFLSENQDLSLIHI